MAGLYIIIFLTVAFYCQINPLILMKKNVFMALAVAFLCTACDEDNPEALSNTPPAELDTVIFNDGTNEVDLMVFEDNKVQQYKIGSNGDETYDLNYSYSYNQDGQLIGMTGTDAQGQLFFKQDLSYDEQGRLVLKHDVYHNLTQGTQAVEDVEYSYNDLGHTITADFTSFDDTVLDRVYHFNSAGLVSKITKVDGTTIQEMQYDGYNIVQMGDFTYTYDNFTEVKGEYINIYRNKFKSYANYVIYTGYMVPNVLSTKYILSDAYPTTESGTTYNYEFDEDGYPIKVNRTSGSGNGNTEILISYK